MMMMSGVTKGHADAHRAGTALKRKRPCGPNLQALPVRAVWNPTGKVKEEDTDSACALVDRLRAEKSSTQTQAR